MTPGEIELKNSDDILHNIHTYSTANPSINKAQPKFKKVMAEKFEKPEMIKLTCDVHSWMLGWVAVMPNPFFGVTDADGTTKIENVPAGQVQGRGRGTRRSASRRRRSRSRPGRPTKVAIEMKK